MKRNCRTTKIWITHYIKRTIVYIKKTSCRQSVYAQIQTVRLTKTQTEIQTCTQADRQTDIRIYLLKYLSNIYTHAYVLTSILKYVLACILIQIPNMQKRAQIGHCAIYRNDTASSSEPRLLPSRRLMRQLDDKALIIAHRNDRYPVIALRLLGLLRSENGPKALQPRSVIS